MSGVVWRFGDDVDTDALAPGPYMKAPIAEIAAHCLEALDPRFAAEARPGDVIVAGESFGIGSSREQAVLALRQLGVSAVLARSFGGIFYRNALNNGLLAFVCPDSSALDAGSRVEVDAATAVVRVVGSGVQVGCEPIPAHLLELVTDGGLVPHLERRFRQGRR